MTRAQALNVVDWLVTNGFGAQLSATSDGAGGVVYTISGTTSVVDVTNVAKVRALADAVDQRGLGLAITGLQIADKPAAP